MISGIQPLTVGMAEAARLLNVSRTTVYRYAKMPGFPAFTIGGRTLVSVEGLRKWVDNQVQEASA